MADASMNILERAGRQRLGDGGLLALLALLSAFIPFSTDMYLPALPQMAAAMHTTPQLVNLTLILFFPFYSVGTLFWGPLSDKYGRKPVLLGGLVLYILASACCAAAATVAQLIVFRVLQAIAGGGAPAIATALVKDSFTGRRRERGLVLVQSMAMLAPIVAPLAGGLLLKVTAWRSIFLALAAIGIVALFWSLLLRETVVKRYAGTIFQTLGQLGAVLRNPGFTALLLLFSVAVLPLYTYLASSAYIYIDEFGLNPRRYSLFFAGNALTAVVAPLCYLLVVQRVSGRMIILGCFATIMFSGIAISLVGHLHPWVLALSIIPATMTMGIIRPPATHLMLEQQQEATGAASSLIICGMSIIGSFGMLLVSAHWHSLILPLGLVHLGSGAIGGLCWLSLSRQPFIRRPG